MIFFAPPDEPCAGERRTQWAIEQAPVDYEPYENFREVRKGSREGHLDGHAQGSLRTLKTRGFGFGSA